MNDALPPALQQLALVVAVVALAQAGRRLPWYKLEGDPEAKRILIVATVALAGLRWFNANALAGTSLHFLGAGVATLMFGVAFALWVMAVVSLLAWLGGADWLGWAPDFIACGLLPVLVAHAVWRFEQLRLPPHLFIFVLLNGFAGGALALLSSHLFKAAIGVWLDIGNPAVYLTAGMLMMFGEGFLCGGAMALVVVYRPHWCASFDDRRYLKPPGGDPGA
ncbi:energy-coupling factor ABC transporter permease [Thermomonas brevis]